MDEEKTARKHFNHDAGVYDDYIVKIIPFYWEMIEALMETIPFPVDEKIEVLDLGCGTGAVTRQITKRFPRAKVTALDVAENMLAVARERLQDCSNIDFVAGDVSEMEFKEKYDLIVSALALHHLPTDEHKRENYRCIFEALKTGGIFINADTVTGASEHLQNLYQEKWKEFMRLHMSEEEIEEKWMPRHRQEDSPAPLSKHLHWLQEVGFQNVDVTWKYYKLAVFSGTCYR